MSLIIKSVRQILIAFQYASAGRYESTSDTVREWKRELQADNSVPTARQDRDNLYSDVERVGRDMDKALTKYKETAHA
jgi:Arc/MetJ-type ribon-helix-helix transcriptional regulator